MAVAQAQAAVAAQVRGQALHLTAGSSGTCMAVAQGRVAVAQGRAAVAQGQVAAAQGQAAVAQGQVAAAQEAGCITGIKLMSHSLGSGDKWTK